MVRQHYSFEVTEHQQFFIDKIQESILTKTIDTYRLPIHNPLTLLKEFVGVSKQFSLNKIKRKEYVKTLQYEVKEVLAREQEELDFRHLSIPYIDSVFKGDDYLKAAMVARLIIGFNTNYTQKLIRSVEEKVEPESGDISYLSFSKTIEYLLIQLISDGFSSDYVQKYLSVIFRAFKDMTFSERFDKFKELFGRKSENFTVLSCVYSRSKSITAFQKVIGPKFRIVSKKDKAKLKNLKLNEDIQEYLHQKKPVLISKVECKDYYVARNVARSDLGQLVDRLSIVVPTHRFNSSSNIAIIGSKEPGRSKLYGPTFIEGSVRSIHRGSYEAYWRNLDRITTEGVLAATEVDKIKSALRYLRIGDQQTEPHVSLINYWIALESLYSVYDNSSTVIERIRTLLPAAHSSIYIQRLLANFLDDAVRLRLMDSDVEECLLDELVKATTGDSVPKLVSLRAGHIFNIVSKKKDGKAELQRHSNRLEWNLMRIYRLRNEITHAGEHSSEIRKTVSHLRYYVKFSISAISEFYSTYRLDLDGDGILTIEDALRSYSIEYSNLLTLNDEQWAKTFTHVDRSHWYLS